MQLFTMTGMSVSISCCWLSESPPLPAANRMAAHQLAKDNFFSPSIYRVLLSREGVKHSILFFIFKSHLSAYINVGWICHPITMNMANLHSPAFLYQNKNILLNCWKTNKKVNYLVIYFPQYLWITMTWLVLYSLVY